MISRGETVVGVAQTLPYFRKWRCVHLLIVASVCLSSTSWADNAALQARIDKLEAEIGYIDEMEAMIDSLYKEGVRIREQHCKALWDRFAGYKKEAKKLRSLGYHNNREADALDKKAQPYAIKYEHCFSRRIYGRQFVSHSGAFQYTIKKGTIDDRLSYKYFLDIYNGLKVRMKNENLAQRRRQAAQELQQLKRRLR